MCLFPRLIRNKKYEPNKKNGGQPPPVLDERCLYVPVGCENCMECRKQKARGWQVRLLEDLKEHKNGKFVTFTFKDESIRDYAKEIELEGYELDNEIAARAIRLFLERWRKKYKKSLRHWLVTELGHEGTENIHIHGIVWTDHSLLEVERIWNSGEIENGWVWKGTYKNGRLENYVNEKTVNYIVKYVTKVDVDHRFYKSRIFTSPGIGRNYTVKGDYKKNVFKGNDTNTAYRTRQGFKIAMPIYWRNKIYSEQERERLWVQMLDKEERWVLGVRVCIKDGDKMYYRALEQAREKNRRLGYGDDNKNWDLKMYENDRRIMLQSRRIERAEIRSAAAGVRYSC